jgi:putative ATP-dependent endonuclease of OLD family
MKEFIAPGANASSAERSTALLLVVGSLLASHGASAFGPKAQPIIAIEDPEAHLHPTILAAVTEVVRTIQAQKIVTTNSGEMLAMLPLSSIRRFVRSDEGTLTFRLGRDTLADDEARRISYHVKANRGTSHFARCWMLV